MTKDNALFTSEENADFVEMFVQCGVRFVIVGGVAVKHFCPKREVDDLDLIIDPTQVNAVRVVHVLNDFCPGHTIAPESLVGPGKQIALKRHCLLIKPINIDLLTPRIETRDFDSLWNTAITGQLRNLEVLIPSLDSLLELKRHAATTDIDPERRKKHMKDVVCLEKLAV